MGLITKITVEALVDGERKSLPPGTDVTGVLSAHDIEVLVGMKALEDTEAVQAAHRKFASEAAKADREFQLAREKVRAQQASLTPKVPPVGLDAAARNAEQSGGTQLDGTEGASTSASGQAPVVPASGVDAVAALNAGQSNANQDGQQEGGGVEATGQTPDKPAGRASTATTRRTATKNTSRRKA